MTTNVDDMSGELLEKLKTVANLIQGIEAESPEISTILLQAFSMGLRTIQQMEKVEASGQEVLNIDAQLDFVSKALGFDLQEIIMHVVQQNFPAGDPNTLDGNYVPGRSSMIEATKAADEATLDFITSASDLDDYEKFLAKAKAKESLDFLKKTI
jgi:hypothetical protein